MSYNVAGIKYRLFGGIFKVLPLSIKCRLLYLLKIHRFWPVIRYRSFNEKLLRRKITEQQDKYAVLADKIASKRFVESRAPDILVPRILWLGNDAHEIDFDCLPSSYLIKANHGSRMNIIVRDGMHPDADELNRHFREWRKHNQSEVLGEVAYEYITPTFFIEEFLNFDGAIPTDYKCFVYHGKVELIQVDTARFENHRRNIMLPDWTDTEIRYSHVRQQPPPKKPDNLREIIDYAERIAAGYDFLRVDLYSDNRNVYFGEITIYPGAGLERFESFKDDLYFGSFW